MYIPLKVTSDYSLLESTIKIDNLIEFLKTNKISACGLCDNYLYGVMEFFTKCEKNNIKPIIGLEININEYPLYLYAKNYQGYQNLLKIHTLKSTRPLNFIDLKMYSQNILAIVPFASFPIFNEIESLFTNTYAGYQNDYEKTNALLKTNHIVFINNIRSLKKEDTSYLDDLKMIRTDCKVSTYQKQNYEKNYYYENVTESDIKTCVEVSELLNVKIPKNENHIPIFNPEMKDSYAYLENLTNKGLTKRLKGNVKEEYQKRLKYELSIIKKMGFVDYILIVYDYVLYAKKHNVFVGPGRGSAAGSLVCYTLGITDIDPLAYNLLFERFLNPERVTMPDIDIDFENTKRGEIIEYIKSRYGEEYVASIITFTTLKSKLALREVARIYEYNLPSFESFLKEINPNISLRENLENPSVKKYLTNNNELKNIYKIALKIEGIKKNISTHAAGVVISDVKLDEVIPIIKIDNTTITGITMEYLEDLGLLKMDLLAIKNLTMISNILDLIKKDTGLSLNLNAIDLNDKEVLNLFTTADTTGIFQFESSGMRNFLEKLKPRNFTDLVAAIALYRPGPMDNIDTFIKRKEGILKTTYIAPALEPILKETEGIIIYQEQVMQILVTVANYTYAEADLIRRAMSKKKREIIEQEEKKFISRAINNRYSETTSKELYELILKFAGYGFNKSHSVSYSLIGYQMAYLKVKFPKYFITNLLNMSIGSETKTKEYILEAKKHNLIIKHPDINISTNTYKIEENTLILPLSIIKGINNITIESIVNERKEHGNFQDFIDFVSRMFNKNCNERILEILINAGVLDSFGNKTTLKQNLGAVLNYAKLTYGIDSPLILKPVIKEYENTEDEYNLELEYFGFYISNHPASIYNDNKIVKLENIKNYFDKYIKSVVLIESIKRIKTKQGEEMAFIEASDETASSSFVIFSKQIRLLDNLKVKDIVEMQGKVTKRFDKYQINVNNMIRK